MMDLKGQVNLVSDMIDDIWSGLVINPEEYAGNVASAFDDLLCILKGMLPELSEDTDAVSDNLKNLEAEAVRCKCGNDKFYIINNGPTVCIRCGSFGEMK